MDGRGERVPDLAGGGDTVAGGGVTVERERATDRGRDSGGASHELVRGGCVES